MNITLNGSIEHILKLTDEQVAIVLAALSDRHVTLCRCEESEAINCKKEIELTQAVNIEIRKQTGRL